VHEMHYTKFWFCNGIYWKELIFFLLAGLVL
jgi:hypothetical protein